MTNLNPVDNYLHGSWEALGNGAPLLVALAQLCSDAWVLRRSQPDGGYKPDDLPLAAQAILHAARHHGMVEIRAVNSAFEASARMLAVYVEIDDERTIAFRDAQNPATTVLFLDGFRDLCEKGLVIHHVARDFSLSPEAFEIAKHVSADAVADLISQATEFGLHD